MTRVMDYPIQSLRNLSLQEITKQKNIRLYSTDQLWLLPPNLKDPIRGVLLKRGYHNHLEIIKPLLHSNVRSLDLSECNKTEELLHTVLESCGHLRKLNLNCNRDENHIGDRLTELLSLLIKRNGFLCVLSMRNFANVSDYVLRNIPHCLSELDLGGCTGISDKGLCALVERCARLTSLSLNRTLITDLSLTALGLSDCRASLRELNLSTCVNITDEGIQDFLVGIKMNDNTPVLNILIFHKCPKLTETSRLLVEEFFAETKITAKQISWTIH